MLGITNLLQSCHKACNFPVLSIVSGKHFPIQELVLVKATGMPAAFGSTSGLCRAKTKTSYASAIHWGCLHVQAVCRCHVNMGTPGRRGSQFLYKWGPHCKLGTPQSALGRILIVTQKPLSN